MMAHKVSPLRGKCHHSRQCVTFTGSDCHLSHHPSVTLEAVSPLQQGPGRRRDIIGAHQAFPDEEGAHTAFRQPFQIGMGVDAAFPDQQRSFLRKRG